VQGRNLVEDQKKVFKKNIPMIEKYKRKDAKQNNRLTKRKSFANAHPKFCRAKTSFMLKPLC